MATTPFVSRSKGGDINVTTEDYIIRNSDGVKVYTSGVYQQIIGSNPQTIAYSKSKRNNLRSNYCIHRRVMQNLGWKGNLQLVGWTPSSPTQTYFRSVYPTITSQALGSALSQVRGTVPQYGEFVLRTNAGAYSAAGFSRLRPDLTEVSVPNFLLEIGDIKSLMNFWNPKRGFVPNVAGIHLNLLFGWKPTYGDLMNMLSAMSNYAKKIKEWNDNVGRVVHKRTTVAIVNGSKSGVLSSTPAAGYTTNYQGNVEGKVSYHLRYRIKPLPQLGALAQGILGHLDAWGFELNPRIIWESIPFSFVVDWFLNVGEGLERLKYDTFELPIDIVDSALQYKETTRVDVQVVDTGNVPNLGTIYYPGGSYMETLFHRVPFMGEPSALDSIDLRMPKPGQLLLLLSLGASRL
jgi:hypothetical protein